jgi:UDP-N-acetylglucosamine 1-carboxyvinyltransferase
MESIIIHGGKPLIGEINISGAKNACLPIMTCTLLTEEDLILSNIPDLTDITTMKTLLENHGVSCNQNKDQVTLNASNISEFTAPYEIVRKMRASIWVLGPLLARFGKAKVSLPGGCAIGARQVDLHLSGLEAMGANITIEDGYIVGECLSRLKGIHFSFDKVSVGATINLIMAACLADGETKLMNCASEPEITDMCHCLVKMGAHIEGIGTSSLTIQGQKKLHGATHKVVADRIEAGTYMIAAAITKGKITLHNIPYEIVENVALKLKEANVSIEHFDNKIIVTGPDVIMPTNIETHPYPGFPTDLQAQFMTLMSIADGTSTVTENIFENRFMHVPELCRMGANITINHHHSATIHGVKSLKSAEVMASDLRASVSLVLAGLAGVGTTKIRRIYHLDRGYDHLEDKLRKCGAEILRIVGDVV